jgi:hypothetical protein
MSDIVIIVNRNQQAQLIKLYADFGAFTKQMSVDLVKEEGALTCRAAIDFSPPLDGGNGKQGSGGGKGAKKIAEHWGNWAVANDVFTVVGEDSKTLASAMGSKKNSLAKFTKWRMGKPPKTQGLASKIWLDTNPERAFKRAQNLFGRFAGRRIGIIENDSALKARHDRIRKMYKGRIRKNGGRDPMTGQVKGEQPHFAPLQVIERYIKTRQLRVGFMKAGWISAINKIGTPKINGVEKKFGLRKIPGWVSRHPAGHGAVGLNTYGTGLGTEVLMTVRNDLGNIFGVGYLAGTRRYVIGVRAGKMSARMRHFMRIAIDKTNAGIPPT